MRFLLVLLIWIVIVGGLKGYTLWRDAAIEDIATAKPLDLTVAQEFTLMVTPTFAVEKDPFALQLDESGENLLDVRLNGKSVDLQTESFKRSVPIRIENLEGILKGHNEIYVKASPPLEESSLAHGVRLQLYAGSNNLVDQTIWGIEGALVSGTVNFSYQLAEEKEHDH